MISIGVKLQANSGVAIVLANAPVQVASANASLYVALIHRLVT